MEGGVPLEVAGKGSLGSLARIARSDRTHDPRNNGCGWVLAVRFKTASSSWMKT